MIDQSNRAGKTVSRRNGRLTNRVHDDDDGWQALVRSLYGKPRWAPVWLPQTTLGASVIAENHVGRQCSYRKTTLGASVGAANHASVVTINYVGRQREGE